MPATIFSTRSTNECLHSSICSAEMYKQKKPREQQDMFTQFQESSLQLSVIKTQVLPSTRTTGTAGTPETQEMQKHLRKPLVSPSVFNSTVTTVRVEGPNSQTCPSDTARHDLGSRSFLYPDY